MVVQKRREREQDASISSMSDTVAGKIASAGIRVQTKISESLNKVFTNMSMKKLKRLLIVFCLGCGGYSIYLIVNAIFTSDKNQLSIKVDQLEVPKHFDRTGDEIITLENFVNEETYHQLMGFKQYMDSLKLNKNKLYDSILIARPGLMDSVLMLEQMYNSQKIK